MLHGTTCYMVLHVKWYYNLHGTKCDLVIHASIEFYMVKPIKWYLLHVILY